MIHTRHPRDVLSSGLFPLRWFIEQRPESDSTGQVACRSTRRVSMLNKRTTRRKNNWLCSAVAAELLAAHRHSDHPAVSLQTDVCSNSRGATWPTNSVRLPGQAPTDTSRPRYFLMAGRRPLASRTASDFGRRRKPKHLACRTCHKTGRTINSCVFLATNR
jgi:hypothetical protein